MQNNFNPNFGYPMNNGGYAYGVARPQPANNQPLTQDIVNTLKQEGSEINMKIDQRDIWRAICTHRDPTSGAMTLTHNADGTSTCSICGATFRLFDGTKADVEEHVNVIKDIFQTIKTLYMDAPVEMTKQYMQQIALLDKLPALFDHAVKNFAKYENVNSPLNPISNSYGGFNALSTLLTNPYAMQPMGYNQPVMNGYAPNGQPMAYQQPMGYNQPMMNGFNPNPQMMQYGQQPMMPMDPNNNPMGYGATNAPIPGQMPVAQNVQQTTTTTNPAPTAQNNEVQQQKVYNV